MHVGFRKIVVITIVLFSGSIQANNTNGEQVVSITLDRGLCEGTELYFTPRNIYDSTVETLSEEIDRRLPANRTLSAG